MRLSIRRSRCCTPIDMNGVRFIAGTSVGIAYVPDVNNAINTVQKEVDAVYFNIDDLSHHNIMIQLNAKRFGKEMPYGLLYAYSYLICKENGFAVPQSPDEERARAVIEQNQGLSDLNVFVFLSAFTSEEQKAAAKWLAIKTADTFGAEKLGEIISAGDVREATYNFDLLTRQVCYDCHIFLWTVLIYMTLSVKSKTFDALFETAYVLLCT